MFALLLLKTGIAEQVWRVEINPEQERIVAYTQPDRDPAASLV